MTYFSFLIRYVGIPIAVLLVLHLVLYLRGREMPPSLRALPAIPTLLGMCLIALIYTTPWDNYLVATNVWFYDHELVTGIVFGWVPIEEYTFFIVQPILAGLFLLLLAKLLPLDEDKDFARPGLRRWSVILASIVWVVSVIVLLADWKPGTYISLELAWALPPIILQLGFGADILWHYRRLVFWSLVPAALYLSAADSIAIAAGTWTIDPAQSLGIFLGGVLPLEEFLFFVLTNMLLVFGITLALAQESRERMEVETLPWLARLTGRQRVDSYTIDQQ